MDDETIGADYYAKSLRNALELCIEAATSREPVSETDLEASELGQRDA
jgi:hypothetical protein